MKVREKRVDLNETALIFTVARRRAEERISVLVDIHCAKFVIAFASAIV